MTPSIWCVVPAAGIGARMGASIAKQYLSLGDKTIIELTLEKLLALNIFEKVVVAISADDSIFNTLPIFHDPRIITVVGGRERSDSVLSGLHYLAGVANANDWVMVHDAARPFLGASDVLQLLNLCNEKNCGGILAIPVSDTLKRVSSSGVIEQTVPRAFMWQAQTPQNFKFGELQHALARCIEQGLIITDEASAIEMMGGQSIVVCGRSDNIKITRPEDLPIAAFIAARQLADGCK